MVTFAVLVGIAWIAVAALSFAVAAVVLAAAPTRGTNRALAALLVLKALTPPPGAFGALVDDRSLDYLAHLSLYALGFVLFGVYLLFIGFALDTPLARPFRRRAVRILVAELMVFGFALPWLAPHAFLAGPGTHLPGQGWVWEGGPLFRAAALVYLALVMYTLAAAISAFRRTTRGTLARRRAKAYLFAFATQDVGVGAVLVYWATHPTQLDVLNIANIGLNLAFSILVATALLRTQIFDFDLKVKIGLTRGATVAAFLAVFFVVAAIASEYLQQYGFIVGGVAVGLLLLAFVPIQRAAESVADRVFPGVSDEKGYLMRKKVEVYREALHEAMLPTGDLEPSRTGALRKLRASMGLTQRDHDMLLGALAGAPASRRGVVVTPGATVLGKYRVERELGAGGGGRAFLAHDVRMKRQVVLKTVSGSDHAAAIREARAAAAVEHPNVVRMYDVEDLGNEALLVMEYVGGGSLKDRIAASGALSEPAFARVSSDILSALEAVHATAAVHRDVKPGNILLTRDGRAKLSDFGTARLPGFETTIGEAAAGSVLYMSPEQARGKRVTALSDLYSAAATLYEARTGGPLFEPLPDESAVETQMRVGLGRAFDRTVAPPALQAWFARALAPSPDGRFQSASEMREALGVALVTTSKA